MAARPLPERTSRDQAAPATPTTASVDAVASQRAVGTQPAVGNQRASAARRARPAATPAKAVRGPAPRSTVNPMPGAAPSKAVKPAKAAKSATPVGPAKTAGAAGKPAKAGAPDAAKPAVAPQPAELAAAKPARHKDKLVRDSFTMPRTDFALIQQLKDRALAFRHVAKKSELLRAGLHALAGMDRAALQAMLTSLPTLKSGRPKKGS